MEKTLANFRAMMEEVAQKYEVNIDECCEKMARILSEFIDPSVEFDFLGSGCYKQTYRLTDDLVIKFVDKENRTKDEMFGYHLANLRGLKDLFVDTWECEMHQTVDLWDLEERDAYPDGPQGCATWIVVQEQVAEVSNDTDYEWKEWNEEYIIGDRVIDCYFPCNDITWLRNIVEVYGQEYFQRFCEFIIEARLGDLHTGNIGYNQEGKPVIFDWLSN